MSGADERSCDLLAMLALMFPERLEEVAMAEIERAANDPVPVDERERRVASVGVEIEELQCVAAELALALRQSGEAERLGSDAPAPAVLGVRVSSPSGDDGGTGRGISSGTSEARVD
jgi:hypothetical protein